MEQENNIIDFPTKDPIDELLEELETLKSEPFEMVTITDLRAELLASIAKMEEEERLKSIKDQ